MTDQPDTPPEEPTEAPKTLTVATGHDELGRPTRQVEAESIQAAVHWDDRLWVRR